MKPRILARGSSESDELRAAPPTRVGLDGWVWIIVIAITPLQQLLFETVSSQVRSLPLVVAALSLLLGRVARFRGQGILTAAALLIVLAGFISGTNSSVSASAGVSIMLGLMVALVPSALAFQVRRSPTFVRNAVIAFLGVQTVSALAAIAQMAGASTFGIVSIAGRARGLAGHPNVLGIMSVIAILILLEMWGRRTVNRGLTLLVLLVNGVAIAGSASLSSLLMLAVGLAFYIVTIQGALRYVLCTLLLVALIGAVVSSNGDLTTLIPSSLESRIDEVTEVDGDRASWNIRVGAYGFALQSIGADPVIGVGMDTMNQSTTQPGLVVHNYLLRGWFQGGLILFVAFLMLTVLFVVSAARYIRQTDSIAPAAILVSMLAFGMTASFYTQSHYWMVILTAFIVMGGLRPKIPKPNPKRRPTTLRSRKSAEPRHH